MSLISMLLTSSATSSALYHLCDTDVWCVGGLNFKSLQIYDILFSTVSVAAVILHHSPWSSDSHSALVICVFSVLVSPISNDPTNPKNIILAISFSISVCILAWISAVISHRFPHLSTKDGTWRSNPGINLTASLSAATQGYAPVATSNDGDNIEMQHVIVDSNPDHCDEGDNDDENGFNEQNEIENTRSTSDWNMDTSRISWLEKIVVIIKAIPSALIVSRWTIVGVALALSGIMCFAMQTRMSYWYLHSLWHILVMSSTLPLLYGRGIFVNIVASLLYVPIRGNAALRRPGY